MRSAGPAGGAFRIDADLQPAVQELARSFYGGACGLAEPAWRIRAVLEAQINARHASRGGPPWLRYVLDRFAWADCSPLRVAAEMAGVHQANFSRTFRKHVGVTPNEYRRHARMRLASDLLLCTGAPLADVAIHCGFSDQSHLTRTFSETLGLPPAQYQRVFAR